MKAIHRTGDIIDAVGNRTVFDAVFKFDFSEGVAWVKDSDVIPDDDVITEAEYTAYADAIRAWNEANAPDPPVDPADTELTALKQLLFADWDGSEAAWAGLTAAQRADHLRARSNALRRGILYLYRYVNSVDIDGDG